MARQFLGKAQKLSGRVLDNYNNLSQKKRREHLSELFEKINMSITVEPYSLPIGTPNPIKKIIKMVKNMIFSMVLLFIWSNTAFSQCKKYIFSMDEGSVYSEGSVLSDLCNSNLGLEWIPLDSFRTEEYKRRYKKIKEMVQYRTHFSNVLENSVAREFATISNKDKKTDMVTDLDIFSIEFYYKYQCDSLISTFNKYQIEGYGSPREEGGSLKVLRTGHTILFFLGDIDLEDKELERIYLVCKKALDED